jgi:predicted nucleic acid-binding protein
MNSAEAVLSAMEFEDLYQISFWDALIVQVAHCKGLLF